jgi:hypothetical protein
MAEIERYKQVENYLRLINISIDEIKDRIDPEDEPDAANLILDIEEAVENAIRFASRKQYG